MIDPESFTERHSPFFGGSLKGKILSVFRSELFISFLLQDLSLRRKGTDLETSSSSFEGKGAEVGGKGDKAGSKLLRGQEEEKDYSTRQALPGVATKGKGNSTGYHRLPCPGLPSARGTAGGAEKYEWPPGKSHDSGAPTRLGLLGVPGSRLPGKTAPSQRD